VADSFRDRLASAIARRGSLCAGVDPTPSLLAAWGLPDSAAGAAELGLRCVDAFGAIAVAIKTNVAFFEQYGAAGLRSLEQILEAARAAGLITIADAKRADIESTNVAYARAWLSETSPLTADALTVVPYLGTGALDPFVERAAEAGRGVFVVARSSNPEGRELQLARLGSHSVEEEIIGYLATRPEVLGAVVGLGPTPPLDLVTESFYLAPGMGAQGAGAAELQAQFGSMADTPVVVNLSRTLLGKGPDRAALEAAALEWREAIGLVLRSGPG
jgi:orotidine-5'-phosphate decarboxylase